MTIEQNGPHVPVGYYISMALIWASPSEVTVRLIFPNP